MIGILGGTFDPVHFGHLRPALEVQEALALDEVRLIPCHVPPHRPQPVATPQQRVRMLAAAVKNYPVFRIDEREYGREGPSYTYDTLISLREEAGAAGICLLIGMDAFFGLTTWHRWRELTDLCHMVVMSRPGAVLPQEGKLAAFIARHQVPDVSGLKRQACGRLLFQQVTQLEISATAVRKLFDAGRNPGFLMPEDVLEYIHQEGLYRADNAP